MTDEYEVYEKKCKAIREATAEGVGRLDYFLGYWFIRKAMWASESSIRENATSLKKFYTYLAEIGRVSAEDLAELREDIKAGLPEWSATVRRYDDPDVDAEEVWQW